MTYKRHTSTALLAAGSALVAISITLGCLNASTNTQAVSKKYDKIDELQPYVEPYKNAYINLGGTPVPTRLVTTKEPGKVRFKFLTDLQDTPETAIDEERYEYDEKGFLYVGNLDEQFSPGIPLLKFPLNIGSKWEWTGEYMFGGQNRKANATIITSQASLNTVAGEFSTVRTIVELVVETGSIDPHTHKLTFWFAPKRGIVKREFELSTTREPMPPDKAEDGA